MPRAAAELCLWLSSAFPGGRGRVAGSETAHRHLTHTSLVFSPSPTLHSTSGSAFLASLCRARSSSLTNSQQGNSVYRGRGGQGGHTWPCHTPCHPSLQSSALHQHKCTQQLEVSATKKAPNSSFQPYNRKKLPLSLLGAARPGRIR